MNKNVKFHLIAYDDDAEMWDIIELKSSSRKKAEKEIEKNLLKRSFCSTAYLVDGYPEDLTHVAAKCAKKRAKHYTRFEKKLAKREIKRLKKIHGL